MKLGCSKCWAVHDGSTQQPSCCFQCCQLIRQTTPTAPASLVSTPRGRIWSEVRDVPSMICCFRPCRAIDAGGMGLVHWAQQIAAHCRVAKKLIAPKYVASADFVARAMAARSEDQRRQAPFSCAPVTRHFNMLEITHAESSRDRSHV
jgi:hypothetical protein